MVDMSTFHMPGVTNIINDSIPVRCASSKAVLLYMLVTGTPEWHRAVFNTVSYTCAFPALMSQNVCCENGLFPRLDAVLAHNTSCFD